MGVPRDLDGTMVLPGGLPVHDLPDLGVHDIRDGPCAIDAGLLLDRLGRVPDAPGDRISIAGWELEVAAVDRHPISDLHVRPAFPPAEPSRPDAEAR